MEHGIRIRTVILLWLFLSGVNGTEAQSYHALPDSNATWIAADASSAGHFYIEQGLSPFRDDTVINFKTYNKIFIKGISEENQYAGAYRSDTNGKTYFVSESPMDTVEHLLFDLSANQGDTMKDVAIHIDPITFWGAYNLVVDSIRHITFGTDSLKCLYLYPLPPEPPYYGNNPVVWLEKIGCLNGGIFNTYMCGLNVMWLRCMSADDTIRYFNLHGDCFFMDSIGLIFDVGVCELPVGIPEQQSATQLSAYPNPFSTTTTIEYELTEPSHVQLSIYNAIGEEVNMVQDRLMAVGKHSFTWSPESIPEGLYFAVLKSKEGVGVVKMVKQ